MIAALITFTLGALSVRGEHAATAAVPTTIILSLKPVLHRWLQHIERQELTAALKLLLISLVVLPVLPDRGYGPWLALNPHELWWLVVLIAVRSFAAYCAVKIAGPEQGILLAGFLGGLVSSTGVSSTSPAWRRKASSATSSRLEYWWRRRPCLSVSFSWPRYSILVWQNRKPARVRHGSMALRCRA